MGRLEKIVVLTVLFLVAVILAVSLNRDQVVAGPLDPELARAPAPVELDQPVPFESPATVFSATTEDEKPVPAPEAAQPEPVVPEVVPEPEPPKPEPRPEAPRALMRTTEGLAPSRMPELMIYTWQAGDSFTALADRYYGSRLEVGRLRSANEGRDESLIPAGEQIWVPVAVPSPSEILGRDSSQAGQWEGGVYVVESGDMLGKIAQKTYGSAGKWRRIFEANRDVLTSPDALKVGMRLRIPAE